MPLFTITSSTPSLPNLYTYVSPCVREAGSRNEGNVYLWNPESGKLCLRNPESCALESRIQLKETWILLKIRIKKPSFSDKEFRIQFLVSRIQDCLAIIRSFEGVNGNALRPFTFHCKLYIMDFRISNILRIFCFTAVCGLMYFVFYRYNVKHSSMESIGNLKIVLSIHKVFPFSISVNFPGYFWPRPGSKKKKKQPEVADKTINSKCSPRSVFLSLFLPTKVTKCHYMGRWKRSLLLVVQKAERTALNRIKNEEASRSKRMLWTAERFKRIIRETIKLNGWTPG